MKKLISLFIATMLCACCLGLSACGDSGSAASSTAGSSSATGSSSAAEESSSAATADPSEKFIGEWKMAAIKSQGVTLLGSMEAMGVGTSTLTISEDGTGSLVTDGVENAVNWQMAGDDAITLKSEVEGEGGILADGVTVTYADETLDLAVSSESAEGNMLFTKDGALKDVVPIDPSKATPVTSEADLIGTWKICGITMEGATMYGDSAALSALNGSEEMVITFEQGGKVTMLGSDATWSIGSNGVVIDDSGTELPVLSIDGDILLDLGAVYGMEALLLFSK